MLEQGFQAVCEAACARWDVPALAVGVSVDGRRETVALGCDPETRFRVASITKPFTAMLAAGLLPLEAAAGVWPGVSVRQLLSHTSGYDCELGDLRRFGDADDALETLVAELPGVHRWVEPGCVWSYANAGYWLAGALAARAAGSSYEAALAALVCGPAGLASTDFGEPDLDGHDVDAAGRRSVNGEGPYPRARRPSGGLVSTVDDLLRFGEWQLAAPGLAALREPVATRPGGAYGLGFMLETVGGATVAGHGGSYGGFQSSLLLLPERGAVVAGLTNSGLGGQALRIVEDELLERLVGTGRTPPPTVALDAAELESLAGRYRQPELELDVSPAPGGLELRLRDTRGEHEPVHARPVGGREFQVENGQAAGHRFDFVLGDRRPRFVRFASRLAERVPNG